MLPKNGENKQEVYTRNMKRSMLSPTEAKVLEAVETFERLNVPAKPLALASYTGLYHQTVKQVLRTLVVAGFLTQDGKRHPYKLVDNKSLNSS